MKDRAARYGLRGTRVGEASHPGPRRRQVIPSTDDDLDSTFLDEFELDLNAPTGSRRSPGAHEQMSPCGCPTAPEAFVLSDDEHLRTPAPSVCVPTNVSTVPAASGELREARRAFLPDSGGPTSIDMCTSPEHESHQLRGNRFAVLSREEDFPHGQAGQGVPRRRLVLTNMESGAVRPSVHVLSNTGSDTESMGEVEARPRGGGFQVHRDVQSADFLMRDLARRIGFVPAGGPLPRPLRVQRWSLMNVPLMWGAAGTDPSTPVLDWLAEVLGEIPDPLEFHGGFIAPSAAVQVEWASLRQAMRSWGISRAEDLTVWLRTNGLPATQRGNHLSARAQEHIMTEACRADARVALLETAFVALALFRGRQMVLPPMTQERVPVPRPSRRSLFVHDGGVPPESWESLDGVDLADTFLQRVPMLQSCPHFL